MNTPLTASRLTEQLVFRVKPLRALICSEVLLTITVEPAHDRPYAKRPGAIFVISDHLQENCSRVRMGVIINPRGTSGSGKTELVRRILAQYGWRRRADFAGAGGVEFIYREGRRRPFGYRLGHPLGGRPLAVVGHYEVTSGGCDTIRAADGGLEEIMRRAADYAVTGHDVLIEGQRLSSEYERSAELARSHRLHILRLTTPLDRCARNLVWRRRARRDTWPAVAGAVAVEHKMVERACERLGQYATVEALRFDAALARAQDLLGIRQRGNAPGWAAPGE